MTERNQIEAAISALEQHGGNLASDVLETTLAVLRRQATQILQEEAKRATLKGERKQVTVMFADISGFTAMSEKLDPEEVRNLINACFDRLGVVIKRYDGYIDKFIGDEIMALFGAPIAHENDPERALRAALDMMAALADFNRQHADKLPQSLALHFGINTGLAIAGGIGTPDRQDYSVIGDPVNLAARLEGLSESGEILVGEQTYRLTAPLFDFDPLPPVKVKGKEKPVRLYRLLRARTTRGQIRGIEGLSSTLVGRKAELERLNAALTRLYQGQGGVISVTGEAGLGKSRLVQEVQQAHQQHKITWAKGHALSYGQDASYLVARDVLCSALCLSPDDPQSKVSATLAAEIGHLFPAGESEIYPYLACLLELPLDDKGAERVRHLEGDALQKRIVQAVKDFILVKASRQPLVLIWDDLHWADPSSLSLLRDLLPLTQTRPVLFLLVYRTVRTGRVWTLHKQLGQADARLNGAYQCLELPPLSPAESHQLVMNLMGSNEQTKRLRQLIVRQAEGNPFFIEEVIRSLIDNGTLVRADNEIDCFITTGEEREIAIPDTLQGVIMARIDQLDPNIKRTLQVASIIGRTFSPDVLDEVLERLDL